MARKTSAVKNDQFGRMLTSLEFFLNPKVFQDPESKHQIRYHLNNVDLVVIRDALQTPVAEKMFACLDQFSDWKVFEDYQDHFHYHHHNIYDLALYPADLTWCREIFGSDATKSFVQELSQRDCGGEVVFSASWYLPGDHSLPHDDVSNQPGEHRQVAFVWHLTKEWKPNWGGDLFWCRKNRYISPSFNSLILFNVGPDSFHHVTQVSPYATSKRLAISGWWTSISATEDYVKQPDNGTSRQSLVELI